MDDHSKAGDKLKDVASKTSVALPTGMDAKEKATHNRLETLKGADFDRAYMQDMGKDHKTV